MEKKVLTHEKLQKFLLRRRRKLAIGWAFFAGACIVLVGRWVISNASDEELFGKFGLFVFWLLAGGGCCIPLIVSLIVFKKSLRIFRRITSKSLRIAL